MSEEKLQELERTLSSTRATAVILRISRQKVWLWRKGVAHLTDAELLTLEKFLTAKLNERVQTLAELTRI